MVTECPKHGTGFMKTTLAGVSKKKCVHSTYDEPLLITHCRKGKPYDAFQSCDKEGCTFSAPAPDEPSEEEVREKREAEEATDEPWDICKKYFKIVKVRVEPLNRGE